MVEGVCAQISAEQAQTMGLSPEAEEDEPEVEAPEPEVPPPVSFLTREQILGMADFMSEQVLVPHWGGTILIRTFSGELRDQFDQIAAASRSEESEVTDLDVVIQLVINGTCDAEGAPLFTEGDVDGLKTRDAETLIEVAEAVSRLNGIGADSVEELAKNSDSSPSDSSGTD